MVFNFPNSPMIIYRMMADMAQYEFFPTDGLYNLVRETLNIETNEED